MKVTSQNSTSQNAGSAAASAANAQEIQRARGGGSGAAPNSAPETDSVEFSSTLGSLSRAMESYSSSRTSQVQALAAQYQSGTYKIDPASIGRGMVSEALAG